jgi:hypothetical protein
MAPPVIAMLPPAPGNVNQYQSYFFMLQRGMIDFDRS